MPESAPSHRRSVIRAALVFIAATLACLLAYLALAVPGAWFPSASPQAWRASELTLARGTGDLVGDELRVTAPDTHGATAVTLNANIRATGMTTIEWIAIGVADDAEVHVLWRSDYAPRKFGAAPIPVEAGRLMPVVVSKDPLWIGHITDITLAIRGRLTQPVRIRGVVVKPAGALETLGDRMREWLAFEGWTGTSINTVVGGADVQSLPLPLLLAGIVALAGGAVALVGRRWPRAFGMALPGIVVGFFLLAWLVLDLRWGWNLVRQVHATAGQYAGKDTRGRLLSADDGLLYAFIEEALKVLPSTPARVFIAADASYFRARAAYHLYPHSVYYDRTENVLPRASSLRPGDWMLVYQRRGIQYDAANRKLKWDDGQVVSAEVKLIESGGALFLIP